MPIKAAAPGADRSAAEGRVVVEGERRFGRARRRSACRENSPVACSRSQHALRYASSVAASPANLAGTSTSTGKPSRSSIVTRAKSTTNEG